MGEFHLRLIGPAGAVAAELALECETPSAALRVAATVPSPFVHELRQGRDLVARFEPAWSVLLGRLPQD